jgi:adenylate cyclase
MSNNYPRHVRECFYIFMRYIWFRNLIFTKIKPPVQIFYLFHRINPHYPDWYLWNLGWAQYFTGEYEEALVSLKRLSNPNNGVRRTLAAVLVRLGRVEEARAVIAAFREQSPDFTVSTMENFPFQNRTYLERWMEDLRTAGLPE